MSLYLCQKCGTWQENLIHGCDAPAVTGSIPFETGWVQLKIVYSKSGGMVRKMTYVDGRLISTTEFPGLLDGDGVPWKQAPEGYEQNSEGKILPRPRARELKELREANILDIERLKRPLLDPNPAPLMTRRVRRKK